MTRQRYPWRPPQLQVDLERTAGVLRRGNVRAVDEATAGCHTRFMSADGADIGCVTSGRRIARHSLSAVWRVNGWTMTSDLTTLLAQGTVQALFQPIIDGASRRPIGYEALARGPVGTSLHLPDALF